MTASDHGPDESARERGSAPDARADLLELRIALVCYGGVSLAIYMHGVTKELQSLLRASRAFDEAFATAASTDDLARSPSRPARGTEVAYFDQLVELARAEVPVSATVDVVAGTSAGGINGICLAKAAVRNASQDKLTDLWMQRGDIAQLMKYGRLGARLGGLVTAVRLPRQARKAWSPLKGDDMCRWLYDALRDMDKHPGEGTLLPDGGTIDLHVTATDVRGTDRIIPLGTGESLHDRTYRRVLNFSYDPGVTDTIGSGDHGVLAFAARATSSFPGAFPAVSLEDFGRAVNRRGHKRSFDPRKIAETHMAEYKYLPEVDPTLVPMMDGGVLANAPFDPVVESIAAKPADRQVARHLLFIEPDPGAASAGATPDEVREGATSPDKPPTWAGTLWAAQTIRGQQSLTNAIEHLGELNDQVATIGHVIAALGDDVEEALTDVALGRQEVAPLTFEELKAHDQRVYDSVPVVAGTLNYRVYCRLKMARVSERLSDDLAEHLGYPKTSPEASFLRAALLQWTQSREQSLRTEREMDVWLAGLDAPYRERRLEFLIDGINGLFPESPSSQQAEQRSRPTRAQLSVIKERAWQLLVEERDKPGRAVRRLGQEAAFASREALQGLVFDEEPKAWADEHSGEIERLVDAYRANLGELTSDSARNLWEAFSDTTERWPEDARRHLASRYAAFPLWDALLFPAQSLSRLAMYNPIRLSRVSPIDATALDAAVSGTKLLGVSFHHFGAFFGLDRRENDYLWGRLDGVEFILRLLRDQHRTRQRTESLDPQRSNDIQRAAFGTVVDQEEKGLGERSTHALIARLRDTIPTAVVPLVGAGTAQPE